MHNKDHQEINRLALVAGEATCTCCNKVKPLTNEFFGISPQNKIYPFLRRCKVCAYAYSRKVIDKVKAARVRAMKTHNITEDEYEKLLSVTNCQACNKELTIKQGYKVLDSTRVIDHCHDTGKIRGVLCNHCNTGMGLLGDNIEGIEKALKYLKNIKDD